MILSVHAIFGAAVASVVPTHPVAGFVLGFTSHFVLDAIPHKDYHLISEELGPNRESKLEIPIYRKLKFLRDLGLISLDAVLGICLGFLFFFNLSHPLVFLLSIFGSLLPDFLTFLYFILKDKSLGMFFRFHTGFVHSKVILKLSQVSGVLLQFGTLVVLITILFVVKALFLV